MRGRFILPGIALAAFAATMLIVGWPAHLFPATHTPAVATAQVAPVAPVQSSSLPPAPSDAAAAAQRPIEAATPPPSAPPETSDVENQAAQPPLPDASALPSYSRDQEARNAEALRSARTR